MRLAAALLVLAALASPVPPAWAAGPAVVVESAVPALPPGAMLGLRARVTLKAGERVTVLLPEGGTLRLSGPYDGPLDGYLASAEGLVGQALRAAKSTRGSADGDELAAVRGRSRPAASASAARAIAALAILRARCRALRLHDAAPRPPTLHGDRDAETIDAHERRSLAMRADLSREIAALSEAVNAAAPPPRPGAMCASLAASLAANGR